MISYAVTPVNNFMYLDGSTCYIEMNHMSDVTTSTFKDTDPKGMSWIISVIHKLIIKR